MTEDEVLLLERTIQKLALARTQVAMARVFLNGAYSEFLGVGLMSLGPEVQRALERIKNLYDEGSDTEDTVDEAMTKLSFRLQMHTDSVKMQ